MDLSKLLENAPNILSDIQQNLFDRALAFREENTKVINDKEEFYEFYSAGNKNTKIHGGFALVHWDRDSKWEEQIKNELKVTIRCIPQGENEPGVCILVGIQVQAG